MPDFTIPTRPGVALLLGAFNTALAFIVGAKTTDSGLDPVTVFYMACALAVMGWVLLHIVPSKGESGGTQGLSMPLLMPALPTPPRPAPPKVAPAAPESAPAPEPPPPTVIPFTPGSAPSVPPSPLPAAVQAAPEVPPLP